MRAMMPRRGRCSPPRGHNSPRYHALTSRSIVRNSRDHYDPRRGRRLDGGRPQRHQRLVQRPKRQVARWLHAEAAVGPVEEEGRQRDRIIQQFPEASGKTFLLSHWNGGQDIPDPYRRGREIFERIYPLMRQATDAWLKKL